MGQVATATSRTPNTSVTVERAPGYYLEIFLVSLAALLLEISYTRVISFKLFYYFVYFVIGLSLLGLGAGGVLVAVSGRIRRASTDSILAWCLLLGAFAIGAGYFVIAVAPINTYRIWSYGSSTLTNGATLLLFCLIMFASFLPIGIILSTLFGRRPEKMAKLYFADLLGAAVACALAVPLIAWIGPPSTIMLAGFLVVAAAFRIVARRARVWAVVAGALALVLAVGVIAPDVIPDVELDAGKKNEFTKAELVYSSWSPLFRVDVRELVGQRGLFHDGLLGAVMLKWDGKRSSLDEFGFERQYTVLPFTTGAPPPEQAVIIGAAAGHEVVASLHFGAENIDAVELNPVTYDP
jgi:predicted membrane-bound spermidine synthase